MTGLAENCENRDFIQMASILIKFKFSHMAFQITLTEHNAGSIRKCIALLNKLRKVVLASVCLKNKRFILDLS